MACINDYFAQQHDVWELLSFTGSEDVYVSEVWTYATDGTACTIREDRRIEQSGLRAWLSSSNMCAQSKQNAQGRRSMRVVWIPRLVQHKALDVREDSFKEIHKGFNHEVAYNNSRASVAALGQVVGAPHGSPTWFLSLHPKVSMTWSFDEDSNLVSVICAAEESKIKTLKDLLGQHFIKGIAAEAMVPAVMYAILLSLEIDQSHQQIKTHIRQVEVRTGHHDWKSRTEPPALGDLTRLSAKVSGYQIRTASCLRKQHALVKVLDFVKRHCKSARSDLSGEALDDPNSILAIVVTLEDKAKAQQTDVEYIKYRVAIQRDALYHLVAQRDALFNQEMAQDCKYLAIAAQRDSSSMKCIAAVTMFFLPGTFMSSLFSIPLFDWNADTWADVYRPEFWKPRLMMFLATTLPLMFVTFTAWLLWNTFENLRRKKHLAGVKGQPGSTMPENEVKAISLKRSSLTDVS